MWAKKTGCKILTFVVMSIPFFSAAVKGNRMDTVLWVFFYTVNEIKGLGKQREQKKRYLLFVEIQKQNMSSGDAKFWFISEQDSQGQNVAEEC